MKQFYRDPNSQILKFEKIFLQSYEQSEPISIQNKNIIICGMGGSAIAGDYLSALAHHSKTKIQVLVWREYTLPSFVNSDWIGLVISYSGNTEESNAMLFELISKGIQTFIMSSGGKLKQVANERNLPFIYLDQGYQPRYAFPMIFGKIYHSFEKLLQLKPLDDKIKKQFDKIPEEIDENKIHNLPNRLISKQAIIVSGDYNIPIGKRFRCQLNENAKLIAQDYSIPEFNHNGLVGLEKINSEDYILITIHNLHFEHPRTKIHREFILRYLENKNVKTININTRYDELLTHMIEATKILDYVSFLTAKRLEVDPILVESINELKLKLSKN